VLSSPDLSPYKASRFKHGDVPGNACKGHGQRVGKVLDASITTLKRDKESSAGRISERSVGTIQDRIFKHFVDYSTAV
jgi:hypothetical protein